MAKDLERKAVEGFLLWEEEDCAAMVLYFYAYSTWEGQFLHMEDLYVKQTHRRKGYGKKLWARLGQIAQERECKRFQWNVLNWNENAISFYKSVRKICLSRNFFLSCDQALKSFQMPYIDLTTSEGWLWFRLNPDGIKQLAASMD